MISRSFVLIFLLANTTTALCGELKISQDSVLAIVTHKGGFAKGLAHNHFVFAGEHQAVISVGETVETLKLEITVPVDKLVVDLFAVSSKWYPILEEMALLDEAFAEVNEKDRDKIRKSMLSKSQLNVKSHKEIKARLIEVKAEASKVGKQDFAYLMRVAMTIRGKEVETKVAANIELTEGKLILEGTARMHFKDFGIKPYSAMLGAVSNQNAFDLYFNLVAE